MNKQLNIFMNGILVGKLIKSNSGRITFSYDQSWLHLPGARPLSISLPLSTDNFEGELVYNFFDNLLPDNLNIRARIQSKFQINSSHPFDLLACIGHDCIGAIQIDDNDNIDFIKHITSTELSESSINTILVNIKNAPLGMQDALEDFRISMAGAQEKAAFMLKKKT